MYVIYFKIRNYKDEWINLPSPIREGFCLAINECRWIIPGTVNPND